jgi:hypothetical protein
MAKSMGKMWENHGKTQFVHGKFQRLVATAGNIWEHLLSMEVYSWEDHSKNQQDDGFIPN